MIALRKSQARGHANYGWLDTYHTFSFGRYQDPEHQQFRALRVINEDRVAPGKGFDTHPHQNMEIITYVLSGALEHRDSLGHGEILRAGELQRMTAGTGIQHSEFNPSAEEPVHLYQIWLLPAEQGLAPSYQQQAFPIDQRQNQWQLVASPTAEQDSLLIHQDVRLYLSNLEPGMSIDLPLASDRHGWLQVLRGDLELSGHPMQAGDGAALTHPDSAVVSSSGGAELMLFDLA